MLLNLFLLTLIASLIKFVLLSVSPSDFYTEYTEYNSYKLHKLDNH